MGGFLHTLGSIGKGMAESTPIGRYVAMVRQRQQQENQSAPRAMANTANTSAAANQALQNANVAMAPSTAAAGQTLSTLESQQPDLASQNYSPVSNTTNVYNAYNSMTGGGSSSGSGGNYPPSSNYPSSGSSGGSGGGGASSSGGIWNASGIGGVPGGIPNYPWLGSAGPPPTIDNPSVGITYPTVGDGGVVDPASDPGSTAGGGGGGGTNDNQPPSDGYSEGYAQGAIVTKPTIARIGERGPEAVLPLTPRATNKLQPDVMEGRIAEPRVPGVMYHRYRSYNRFGSGAGGSV